MISILLHLWLVVTFMGDFMTSIVDCVTLMIDFVTFIVDCVTLMIDFVTFMSQHLPLHVAQHCFCVKSRIACILLLQFPIRLQY